MSYEHCDRHDQDATNGCAACEREALDGQHGILLFAFCEHCKTLFTGGAGKWLDHICRTRTKDGLHEERRRVEFQVAHRIDDLGRRTWYPGGA